jgi:hypothetical protein
MKYWVGFIDSSTHGRAGWCIVGAIDRYDAELNALAVFRREGYTDGLIMVYPVGHVVGYYEELEWNGGQDE